MANSKDRAAKRVQDEKRQCKILSLRGWKRAGTAALLACILEVNCREANADQVGPCLPVEAIDNFLLGHMRLKFAVLKLTQGSAVLKKCADELEFT